MNDKRTEPAGAAATPDLGQSLAGVVDAVLGVGASLARVVAEATAPDGVVEPLPPSTPAFQAIVRYGVTAMGHVATALISGGERLRTGAAAGAGSPPSPATPATARAGGPRVQAGATLRVPLSVENPGDRPMTGLSPRVRAFRVSGGADASGLLAAETIRFAPGVFDVAPRDFEKLTVFLPVPEDMPAGAYELVLALGPQEPDLTIAFAVVARPAG
jgi:hypothetical protein